MERRVEIERPQPLTVNRIPVIQNPALEERRVDFDVKEPSPLFELFTEPVLPFVRVHTNVQFHMAAHHVLDQRVSRTQDDEVVDGHNETLADATLKAWAATATQGK
jgi:hypothetical protein